MFKGQPYSGLYRSEWHPKPLCYFLLCISLKISQIYQIPLNWRQLIHQLSHMQMLQFPFCLTHLQYTYEINGCFGSLGQPEIFGPGLVDRSIPAYPGKPCKQTSFFRIIGLSVFPYFQQCLLKHILCQGFVPDYPQDNIH